MRSMHIGSVALLLLLVTACDGAPGAGPGDDDRDGREGEGENGECTTTDALEVYERRIEPLVSGAVPSSCSQCHLAGVSLASYVQDTPCETMACLIDSGEVDLANPEGSPILSRILNAQPDSALITEEVIRAEHDGFLEWIEFSAICQDDLCGVIDNPCGSGTGAPPPPDVLNPIGGCDETALVASFTAKIFSDRGRCNSCHASYGEARDDNEDNGSAPLWIDGITNDPDGDDARNTMYNIIGRGLLNAANPEQSLLVKKPQNLPDEPHLGGAKFENTSDASYLSFLSWIRDDYALCIDTGGEGEGEGEGESQIPVAELSHPGAADGPRPRDVAIPWIGNADDPQDGALTGSSLIWTSDQIGAFGEGEAFDASLPVGTHLVTLTATDSDGNTGTDSVTVVVE